MEGFIIKSDAQLLLEEEYPIRVRSLIVPSISGANKIVAEILKMYPFLAGSSSRQTVGMIRKDAIEEVLKLVFSDPKMGIKCEFRPNVNGSAQHLELVSERLTMTVSHVPSFKSFPREALFRNVLCACNEDVLFADFLKENTEGTPYGIITYGINWGRLSFARIGIPHYDWNGWLAEIDLLKEPHNTRILETAPIEVISDDNSLEIKENIIKDVLNNEK